MQPLYLRKCFCDELLYRKSILIVWWLDISSANIQCWKETKSFWALCSWVANLKILHPTRSQEFFISIPKIQQIVHQIINLTFCPFLVVWRSSSISTKYNYCLYVHVCKIKPVYALSYVGGNFVSVVISPEIKSVNVSCPDDSWLSLYDWYPVISDVLYSCNHTKFRLVQNPSLSIYHNSSSGCVTN